MVEVGPQSQNPERLRHDVDPQSAIPDTIHTVLADNRTHFVDNTPEPAQPRKRPNNCLYASSGFMR
jgi:hypothetical protein